jgi:hypothetical protein
MNLVRYKLKICCELLYEEHVKLPLLDFFISDSVDFMPKLYKGALWVTYITKGKIS